MTENLILAERLQRIPAYPFAAISKRVRQLVGQGLDVIQLDIGSPDLPPPPACVDALCESAANPKRHGYGGFSGTPELRQAFASYYSRRFGVPLDPEREVLPLLGSKEGIVNIHLALINPGDIVLVPDPCYTAYQRAPILAGGEPFPVPLDPTKGFLPALDQIPANVIRRARLLWINYPNNPTGAVATLDDYELIVAFCRKNNIMLCSDNPYADVTFDGAHAPSVLEVSGAKDLAVEFNSISKTFNMAGWRIGVCVGNADMIDALLRIKSNIDSGLFNVIQDAACVALTTVSESWIRSRNRVYEERRDVVLSNLDRIGLRAVVPLGGLYVWAAIDTGSDEDYVRGALEEAHVSLSPGSIYGPSGRNYVRISLVVDTARMLEAINRLAQWYRSRN